MNATALWQADNSIRSDEYPLPQKPDAGLTVTSKLANTSQLYRAGNTGILVEK